MNGFYERKYEVNTYNCDRNFKLKVSDLVEFLQDIAHWHSEDSGYGYGVLSKLGYAWILYKWKIRIDKMPLLGTVLTVKTWSSGVDRKQAYRSFRIYDDSTGELVGEAISVWIFMDINIRMLVSIPQEVQQLYFDTGEMVLDAEFLNNPSTIIREILSSDTYKVRAHDIDYNGHVNNAKYFEFVSDIMPQDYCFEKCELEVTYKRECLENDCLDIIQFDTEQPDTFVAVIKQMGVEENRKSNVFFKIKKM